MKAQQYIDKQSINSIGVVDLFCGVGGLSKGMFNEGLNIIAGFDIDQTCKYAYEKNDFGKRTRLWQEIVTSLLKRYVELLCNIAKSKWMSENVVTAIIDESHLNFEIKYFRIASTPHNTMAIYPLPPLLG